MRVNCCTARLFLPRDALLSAVYAVVVCLCVCVSVTLRYCIKTAKRRITQTTPHDSPTILVSDAKYYGEIRTLSPLTGATNAGGADQNSSLSTKNAL